MVNAPDCGVRDYRFKYHSCQVIIRITILAQLFVLYSGPFFRCASFPFSVLENAGPATIAIESYSCILTSAITVQVADVAGGTAIGINIKILVQSLIILIAVYLAISICQLVRYRRIR